MPGSQGAQLATELAANPAVPEVIGQGHLGAVAVCRLTQPPRSRLPITAVAMPCRCLHHRRCQTDDLSQNGYGWMRDGCVMDPLSHDRCACFDEWVPACCVVLDRLIDYPGCTGFVLFLG